MENLPNIICESVLDDGIERTDVQSSSVIAKLISSKNDWSVWLTISVYRILNYTNSMLRNQRLEKMVFDIDDYFCQHPAVIEHTLPQLIASDDITHQFKVGCEVCFRSMRQYVKFFYGLLSVIESLQVNKSINDSIEVDSDSDSYDSTWKIKRSTALENLIVNALSFDFEEELIDKYMNDLNIYRTKWNLSESKQIELKESILDNIENNHPKIQNEINGSISYNNQILILIYSSNRFKGLEFDPDEKKSIIKDILDSWIAYIKGYSDIEWDAGSGMFSFNISRLARFYSAARMERFLLSLLNVCGPAGFLHHRALYIQKWDDDFKEHRYVVKEYCDYDFIYNYHSHYPHESIDEICKILVPIGELFGISKERTKTYVQNKFEYDDFSHPNPRYKGERFRSLDDENTGAYRTGI